MGWRRIDCEAAQTRQFALLFWQEVLYADFNWNLILKLLSNKIKFTDIPKYPEVRRDLSLLVDTTVAFETIYNIARQTEKSLLKNIDFRIFEIKSSLFIV